MIENTFLTIPTAIKKTVRLYLDNCCFNRPFDDQSQLRIRLESEAKLSIQEKILVGSYQLVWSYILDYENHQNPFPEKAEQIAKWRRRASEDIAEDAQVLQMAAAFSEHGFRKWDALHLACAVRGKCAKFLTTDDGILKKAEFIQDLQITDPIGFIKEEMK